MTATHRSAEFVTLWTAHARRVYGLIYSLVPNWNDADDLLQETSVVLMEKFDEFQPGTSFFAWASRVAYLKVLEFHRRNKLNDHLGEAFFESVFEEVEQLGPGLDGQTSDGQLEALSSCLEQLPEKDRNVLQLRYRDGSTVPDVARELGRTASAVYKALARIHSALLLCMRGKLAEGERQ